MLRSENKKIKQIDYTLLLPVFLLCLIGFVSQYVALIHDPFTGEWLPKMILQGSWYLLGGGILFLVMLIPSQKIMDCAPYLYFGGLILMGLLLLYYDQNLAAATGSKNWFRIFGITFQPAELIPAPE